MGDADVSAQERPETLMMKTEEGKERKEGAGDSSRVDKSADG